MSADRLADQIREAMRTELVLRNMDPLSPLEWSRLAIARLIADGELVDKDTHERLLGRLRAVTELHHPHTIESGMQICWHCDKWWPCPTVRAVTGERVGDHHGKEANQSG